MRIQTKLAIVLLSLSLAVIIIAGVFSTITLDNYFRERVLDELKTQSNEVEFLIRTIHTNDSSAYSVIQEFAHSAGVRVTLIDEHGTVIFESELKREELSRLENHLQRPEVQEALTSGTGTNLRKTAFKRFCISTTPWCSPPPTTRDSANVSRKNTD